LVLLLQIFDEGENIITVALNGAQTDETEAIKRRRRFYSIDNYNGWPALQQWTQKTSCSSLKDVSDGVLYPK
jgi:hypothetical protein